ncbi:hypothetical protein OG455_09155 [Kitasatospora sp. NBC_01287]|uniref:hypothetical protein n=1 Tax=Kitasatospora sp. NBC_01287 TaxID=2903573 RepID=UPI00225BE5DF|nr:hypothetical protein [Kitasatospora sp. NBC_01287]MCX4745687.1 hypothetical protein [Kitasatospora sp. NBC_01287]
MNEDGTGAAGMAGPWTDEAGISATGAGTDARSLYHALREYEGGDAWRAVVAPWLAGTGTAYRTELAAAATRRPWWTGPGRDADSSVLEHELYALGRVSDLLLLDFQPDPDGVADQPWARGPGLSPAEYVRLFSALGMTPFEEAAAAVVGDVTVGGAVVGDVTAGDVPAGDVAAGAPVLFDPFRHEITKVEQAEDPAAPIEVVEVRWPGLMLGQLLFSRAGVKVRAGAEHAERGVADRSPLYWTFLRRYRPAVDLSHGWGSNSQWRTSPRLDYETPTARYLNAAADGTLGSLDLPDPLDTYALLLTRAERLDLLRHRCLLRSPRAAEELAAADEHWQRNLFPFDWRLPEAEL